MADVPIMEDVEEPLGSTEHPPETGKQDRPSEYLRARCPLCFGGQTCYDPSEM
jgi:hypothetical protein